VGRQVRSRAFPDTVRPVIRFATSRRLATALLSAALSTPLAIVPPAYAADPTPSPTESVPASPSGTATPSPSSTAPIPCPHAIAPKVSRPPRPIPPPDNPAHRIIGGERLATSGLVVPDGAAPPPPVTALSWIVADLDTGAVLGACGPHEYGTPASVLKLLLVATMLPKLDPQQVITVTADDLAIKPGTSLVGLVQGGHYTIETLWLGLLLQSGNDAANVLARLGGGEAGRAGGVQAMNDEALHLGAFQTHTVNPSGLDGKGQFTSAYDLALIARACFADETFRRYTLTKQTTIPAQPPKYPKGFQIQNENKLIFTYPGALGGKTGFTDLARHTYVGAAERNGRRLVVTLLGGEPRPLRGWQQGAALLDWGFTLPSDASVGRLVAPGEVSPTPSPSTASSQDSGPSVMSAANGRNGFPLTPLIIAGTAFAAAVSVLAGVMARRRRVRRR
jgi:serine-type D-Ala-D-Ala carboxypeptidase (penicillin-binding protein 5/6)